MSPVVSIFCQEETQDPSSAELQANTASDYLLPLQTGDFHWKYAHTHLKNKPGQWNKFSFLTDHNQ